MAELKPRTRRFPLSGDKDDPNIKLKGFYEQQRERIVLEADEKPQHGVSQPMPLRKT